MNQKVLLLSIILLVITLFSNCTQQSDFPVLSSPYLGQKSPGMSPEIFAPGIISLEGFHDFKGSFSPDGKEYYFCRHALPDIIPTLFFTKIENGIWLEPTELPVAQGVRTFHPYISHDNQWLLFYWQFRGDPSQKSGYYASARSDTGWSVPQYAGQGSCITGDNSDVFYATEIVQGSPPEFYLKKITFRDGLFTHYKRLYIDTHYGKQTHPCIAPDGSYIIFDIQDENTNLFVSFKNEEGHWGEVIDMTKHGLHPGARGATISPDGKYLFYGYEGDIWWVDAKIIEELKPDELK